MRRALAILAGFAVYPVYAQVTLEAPPAVHRGVDEPARTRLINEHTRLAGRKPQIEAGVISLNADCGKVDSQDAARVSECRARNDRLRGDVAGYRKELAAYKCALAAPSIAAIKEDVEGNQEAIRRIGLETSAEAYEELEKMTKDQLHHFEEEMLEATFGAFLEIGKLGVTAAGAIKTAEGRKIIKWLGDLGIKDPRIRRPIEAFYKARNKGEKAEALNEALGELKKYGATAFHSYRTGQSPSGGEFAWRGAAIAMVMTEEMYPELAQDLTKALPSHAKRLVKKLTVAKHFTAAAGAALAVPAVSFAHNLRALGYTKEAVQQLDIATDQQLDAVDRLHERTKALVKQIKDQRAIMARCPG